MGQQSEPERHEAISRRRARVMELKADGFTFREIAGQLGVSLGLVHKDFEASLTRVIEPAVQEYRASHVARLAKAREVVEDVLARRHYIVSEGRAVRDPDSGTLLDDDGVVLAATDRLLKIDEAERKLLGLDAKPEVQITGALRYVITGMPAPGDGGGELPASATDGTDGDDAGAGG